MNLLRSFPGIDLGTTTSCVGIWQNGRVQIIANEDGNYTTPSYVSFTDEERLIGDGAKAAASLRPENTVFDAKRLIGRKFSDKQVQLDATHWPFKLVPLSGDKPGIEVNYLGEQRQFTPEEISAMVLTKMKSAAEAFLGQSVYDAVITVPAYFNDSQRAATKDAGAIAGLKVHRIINEPTAAALAYGLDDAKSGAPEKKILVFDLGGGTFDVSLLEVAEGAFEVLATAGDTHLGGEDFDNRVVDYLAAEFEKRHKASMKENARAMRRLRTAAERAKRQLSSQVSASVEVDALFQGIDFRFNLSRAKFEELNIDLFRKCLQPVDDVLRMAKVDKASIHDVVLVGGSTRIPKVRALLQDYFQGKELCMSINPDEAVAFGAAVQAAILSGASDAKLDPIVLIDVAPLDLGIETAGGLMAVLVPANTRIPCSKEEMFSTAADNQTGVDVRVFQGNRSMTSQNHLLGNFRLSGIPPAPRGTPKIKVTFGVDADGLVTVTATDSASQNTQSIRITNDSNRLSPADILRMQEEARQFKSEDDKVRSAIEAKNKFSDLLYHVESTLKEPTIASKISSSDKERLEKAVATEREWLDAEVPREAQVFQARQRDFEAVSSPIMAKIHQSDSSTDGFKPSSQNQHDPVVEEVD